MTQAPDSADFSPKRYRYWRIRTMYASIIGYAAFYLVRMNFPVMFSALGNEFNYTKADLGKVITLFSIVYGSGKFINGYLSDRMSARYFMTIGLIGSALINICMGFGESLLFFAAFWAINAWFQSMAWPPAARLLTHWFSPKELGTKWGMWNVSHQIGGAAILLLAGFLIEHYGWRYAFFVPSGIALLVSIFLFNRLRDIPQSVGLPSVEVYKGLPPCPSEQEDADLTPREVMRRVFSNRLLWLVCLGNMCVYIVRLGVFNWAPTFLQEMRGSSLLVSAAQTSGFELAGLFGGIAAGWLSDKIFKGRRGPVSFLYMIFLVVALVIFWQVPAGYELVDAALLIAFGFLVYGPQVLVGVAAADFASKKAAGIATGLTGTFGYLGAAISGYGIGKIADVWGWEGGFIFFIVAALCGAFCFALTWKHRAKSLDHHDAMLQIDDVDEISITPRRPSK